ncbi:MAG: NADP-dependent oxidoreductase [Oceanicoccus sp.]
MAKLPSDNRQWILARTPLGGYPSDGDFRLESSSIPEPDDGQCLSRTLYLSLDPYQWGRRRSGVEQPGDVCHGRTVSTVIKSCHSQFHEGDIIFNTNGWQDYGLTGEGISTFGYMLPRRVDPELAPISTALGALGMLGLTAYAGTALQCQPQSGETFVVSAASGGVGQIAGQIAKIYGCRVVGIAGVQDKCDFLQDVLGFDAAVSHLSEDFSDQLANACPDGIDMYFENVGGKVFDAVLPLFNQSARISRCGLISQYGNTDGLDPLQSWHNIGQTTFDKQAMTVHSLFVGDFVADHQAQFLATMSQWITDGKVKYKEDLWTGLEQAPTAFAAMLTGKNFGKTIIAVGDDPTLTDTIRHRRNDGDILA